MQAACNLISEESLWGFRCMNGDGKQGGRLGAWASCKVHMNHTQSCLLSREETAPTYFPTGRWAMRLGGGGAELIKPSMPRLVLSPLPVANLAGHVLVGIYC